MTEATRNPNYTEEMVDAMVADYQSNPTKDTVAKLSAEFGKTTRSIVAKLVREGVYVAAPRVTKTGAPVVRKAEIVTQIQDALGIELPTLEKASKQDLESLLAKVAQCQLMTSTAVLAGSQQHCSSSPQFYYVQELNMIHSLAFEADTEFDAIEVLEQSNPELRYTAFMCYDRSLRELRQRSDETVYGSGGWKCSHEHDCCGCWALLDMEVAQIGENAFILVENWRQNV